MSVCITSAVNVRVKRPAFIKFYCLGPNILFFISVLDTQSFEDVSAGHEKGAGQVYTRDQNHSKWTFMMASSMSLIVFPYFDQRPMTNHESEISRIKSSKYDPKQVYVTSSNGGGEGNACKLDSIMTPDCKANLYANPKQLQKYSFHTEFKSADKWAIQM